MLPHLSKCTHYLVSSHELRFLSKLFRDLASRSGTDSIDRHTFLQFFPLPVWCIQGLWGERLFEKFDRSERGHINFEDFIQGLSCCSRGSQEEKLRFLFELYDLRNDGYLDKEELVSMVRVIQVHNTYKHTMERSLSDNLEFEESKSLITQGVPSPKTQAVSSPKASRDVSLQSSPVMCRRGERKSSAALIKRDEFGTQEQVEAFVDKVLEGLNAGELFDFQHFTGFVKAHPKIMDVFTGTFREDVWAAVSLPEHIESFRALPKKSCFCTSPRSQSVRVATTRASSLPGAHVLEKAGWMYTKPRDVLQPARKVFVMLRSTMLLVYVNPGTALPSSVIFLEGCFVDTLKETGGRHGFAISHQFEGFEEVTFWCASKEDSHDWAAKILRSAKTRNIEDLYELKDRLGTGKFSDVHLGVELTTNLHWAIKVVEKKKLNEQEREMMRTEVAIMRLLNHPNVVQMKEMFADRSKMYLVMELVEGGELFDRIRLKKVFSEFTAFHITRQLLETVKYLHDVGIVHRDIKPENILLSDDSDIPTIKVADFGLSKLVGPNDTLTVACGTLGYVAPEVLMQQPYGKQVDLWSIGVVTYLMLRGRLPFDSKDKHVLIQKTIEARLDLNPAYWGKYTQYALDFLRKVLAKDPAERLSVEQALEHTWIRNGEILIPRKFNRKALDDDLMKKTFTNAKMMNSIYSEQMKEPPEDTDTRVVYTTPDIFEDMEIQRRCAEKSLAINLLDS
jgi:serine/threonine protein kinase/Ca2+-binding EF-hand superfamily protein